VFALVIDRVREHKLLKARTRQRTDSPHVLAVVRDLNRREKVVETLRATLHVLAPVTPDWGRMHLPLEGVERDRRRAQDYRLAQDAPARERLAAQVGTDGPQLLELLWSPPEPTGLRSGPVVATLRQIWGQNFVLTDGIVGWRPNDNVPRARFRLSAPDEVDARYAHKRRVTWVGDKVHLTATCEEEVPHLIRHSQPAEAVRKDNPAVPQLHRDRAHRQLLPSHHLVDAGDSEAQQ
jgi:transposase